MICEYYYQEQKRNNFLGNYPPLISTVIGLITQFSPVQAIQILPPTLPFSVSTSSCRQFILRTIAIDSFLLRCQFRWLNKTMPNSDSFLSSHSQPPAVKQEMKRKKKKKNKKRSGLLANETLFCYAMP